MKVVNATKARVVRIGNSRGIRIPKVLLEQLEIGEEVEMSVHRGGLTIRSARRPREGWADAFRQMAVHGDDRLLDQPALTKWQAKEWEW
ncbi:MAG TPA: AbrB/MazE/SpoVT family DNA-binding domain-containing protein [bacterium]|nr:AbrB/MazE/SpoVT family DNA-binding domain-containing protein [bacterium]